MVTLNCMARRKIVETDRLVLLLVHKIPFLEINNEGSERVRNNWLAHGCLVSYLEGLDLNLSSHVYTVEMNLCELDLSGKRLRINKRRE
jgi:hypothetical protein